MAGHTRATMDPTRSGSATRKRMRRPLARVTYQPAERVEGLVRRRFACPTENAAHARIMRIRGENAAISSDFLAVGALSRLVWFIDPTEAVLARQPIPPLTADLVVEAVRHVGFVIGALVGLPARLNDPVLARGALREVHRAVAQLQMLARAISQQYGWTP